MRQAVHFDSEAIICGLHIWRELRPQPIKVEVGMEVREDCPSRLDALYPGERIIYAEMAGMRAITQSVHYPDIEPLQGRNAGRRQPAEVARIGQAAKPETEGGYVAVLLEER